jgi:hypothetical protein
MTGREAFEAEYARLYPFAVAHANGEKFAKDSGGYYEDVTVSVGWGIWQAATAAERERAALVCEAYAIDQHALYKGKPPYTGKEPQRYSTYIEGISDGADVCADKIRGGS